MFQFVLLTISTDALVIGGAGLSEEMISMAEYLGIKVISEQHLLWIVGDALHAPLPTPWIILKVRVEHEFNYEHGYYQNFILKLLMALY